MEETLQLEETTQCIVLPPAGLGNHRPNGSKANHAITFKLDHLMRANQLRASSSTNDISQTIPPRFDRFECPPLVTDIYLARFEQVHEIPLITCVESGFSTFFRHFGGG